MSDGPLPLAALTQALSQMQPPVTGMGTPNVAPVVSALSSALGSVAQPPPPAGAIPGMQPSPAGGLMPTPAPAQSDYSGPNAEQMAQMPINLGSTDQGAPQVPKPPIGLPNAARFIQAMFQGGNTTLPKGPLDPTHAPVRPVSRLDAFEDFLGNFLNSFSMGMQNAGQGPAANQRGFGAAMMGPYQQQLQQFQMQQQARAQEAQIGLQQAEAQQRTQQVMTPYGMMPLQLAQKVWPAGIGAQARVEAAGLKRFTMNSLGQVLDTRTGQVMGGSSGAGGIAPFATVTKEMADKYDIPEQYIGKQVKNSDLAAFMNHETRDLQLFQTGEGPRIGSKTGMAGGAAPSAPLGSSPAVNAVSMGRLKITTANQARSVETNQNEVDLALNALKEIRADSGLIQNALDAGRIQMAMASDGTVQMLAGRNVKLTDKEAKFASNFQTMMEKVNLLRIPLGAAGFRGEEGWFGLQSQKGSLAQNPQVFNGVLDNTIQSFQALRDANQNALDVYNSVQGGKNKATGGGGGKIDLDALANKYKPKGQ